MDKVKNYKTSSAFIELYEKIKKENDIERKISLCIKFNKSYREIRDYILSYSINQARLTNRDCKEIYDEIYDCFKEYFDYKKQLREKDRIAKHKIFILKATKIIQDFVNSPLNRKEFCQKNHITNLSEYVSVVKKIDNDLYNKYQDKINTINYAISNESKVMSLELLNYLKNGINEKSFDIIDYYLYINCSLKEIARATNYLWTTHKILRNDLNLIQDFLYNIGYRSYTRNINSPSAFDEIDFNSIMSEQNIFLINGEERIITCEEKQNIYNYLVINEIPATRKAYRTCINRLITGIDDFKKHEKIHK